MKLQRNERRLQKRDKSGDLIRPIEVRAKSDTFDPRLDLPPGELDRLKERFRTARKDTPQFRDLSTLRWLTLFDPEIRDIMRATDGYKEMERKYANLAINDDSVHRVKIKNKNLAWLLLEFPEERLKQTKGLDRESFDEALSEAKLNHATPNEILKEYLYEWLILWPEKRRDILREFFPLGVDEWISTDDVLESETQIEFKLQYAAKLVTMFPEFREHIIQMTQPYLRQKEELLDKYKKYTHGAPYEIYHLLLEALTILGAERSWIDPADGTVKVELKALTHNPAQHLPERFVV